MLPSQPVSAGPGAIQHRLPRSLRRAAHRQRRPRGPLSRNQILQAHHVGYRVRGAVRAANRRTTSSKAARTGGSRFADEIGQFARTNERVGQRLIRVGRSQHTLRN